MSNKKTSFILPEMLGANPNGTIDTFRLKFGFWDTYNETGITFTDTSADSDITLVNITSPEPDTYPILPTTDSVVSRNALRQTITIEEKRDASTTTLESWRRKVESFVPSDEIEHIVTSFDDPLTKEEALNLGGDTISAPSGVNYVYNFYNQKYENVLNTVDDHVVIQSLYSMFDASSRIGTRTDAELSDVPGSIITDIDILPSQRGNKNKTLAMGLQMNKRRSGARQKFQNQIIPIENMPLLADYEGSKNLFPMYAGININLDKNNEFVRVVKDTSMGIALTRDIEGVTEAGFGPTAPSVRVETINFAKSVITTEGDQQMEASSVPVKVVDLFEWANFDAPAYAYDATDLDGYPAPSNFYFVGSEAGSFVGDVTYGETDSITVGTAECTSFSTLISSFKDGMDQIAADKRKRIRPLLEGKENYSETVMYKIQKLLGPIQNPPQAPIQTFHFMNSAEALEFLSEERKFKFVDTQVKYNQEYSYIVTAYQMVVAEKYVYRDIEIIEPTDTAPAGAAGEGLRNRARIDVYVVPSIKLVEIPLFVSTGRILDNPPMPPVVNFYPLVSNRNKIKMFFTSGVGTADKVPITLTAEEEAGKAQVAINQNRNDGMITFKTDDFASSFEVFRLTSPPVTLQDFAGKLHATVSTSPASMIQADSSTIEITQTPNTKYYYIFRAIDIHGGVSNPSPIYEIELYNDGGAGYPIIRHYTLGQEDPKTTIKTARKIIQITPRIAQVFLNESASGLVNAAGVPQAASGNRNIILGNQDDPLFGKKFKVRLTSKSTGKKLDLNINFKTKRIRGVIES
mgnify:CR=1 FL=1